MRRNLAPCSLIILSFLLSACGASLSDKKAYEQYPLRQATASESQKLDQCLHSIFNGQKKYRKAHGKFSRSLRSLNLGKKCAGLKTRIRQKGSSYEATAKLNAENMIVKWSLRETGEVHEHSDYEIFNTF